ncbi:MAG: hypothetical protein U9N79_01510, partial [Actinomycetota bacterium]|nr:hypothetical protein [Actinomycetota bacterium]
GTTAPGSTTTTGATDGSNTDDGAAPGSGECTVVVTGDREDTWMFEGGVNRVGIATDYWFSDEAMQAAVEELGGSYDEFVAKGEPLVSFLSIWCSASDDPMEPGQGVDVRATNATRSADLAMGPGSYAIVGGGGVIDEGPAGTMVADVMLVEDEIYETIVDSGSLEISRWDMAGIEGSFSFVAVEMFAEDPKEIQVAVQFSLVCETPGYTC